MLPSRAGVVLHPLLAQPLVGVVLLEAALPGQPLVFAALGGVVLLDGRLVGVREGVGRLNLPLHHSVLCDELQPLGGPGAADVLHGVLLAALGVDFDAGALEDLVLEVGPKSFFEVTEAVEAGLPVLSVGRHELLKLLRQQPEVVPLGLGDHGRRRCLEVVLLVGHMVVIGCYRLVRDHVGGLRRPAPCPEQKENRYHKVT